MNNKSRYHTVNLSWEIEEGVEVPLIVRVEVSKYYPAVYYLKNGDPGYPAEGGELEEIEISNENGTSLPQDIVDRLADDDNFRESIYAKLADMK